MGLKQHQGILVTSIMLDDHKHPQSPLFANNRIQSTFSNAIMHASIY